MHKIVSQFPVICLLVLAAGAQPASRDMVKERAIWHQLEKIAPKALPIFKSATEASDKGNHAEAAQLYEQVMKQAPEFDPVYRRLGLSYFESGRAEEGIALLERANVMNLSPENASSLAYCLSRPRNGNQPKPGDLERALILAQEAVRTAPPDDPSYLAMLAEIALQAERDVEFRNAVDSLKRQYPNEMTAHYFTAVRAMMDGDSVTAEREVELARSMGLSSEVAEKLLDSGLRTEAMIWRYFQYAIYLVAAWLLGLLVLFILGKLFSNFMLRSIEAADPNGVASAAEVSLRTWYKRLVNTAGVYYYISLPMIVLIVLGITGSILYGFLIVGYIPIKLAIILLLAAALTIWKMARSLFIKIEREDPGRALNPEEAPGLWELTREVAKAVGTRPIDGIRITAGCDLAVYEKGSFREKLQDRARRNLILGVGVLNGMQTNAFRAVLAHEYGHFSHRDTAGGDVALRVNQDMVKFAYALAYSGQAVWWNIAFQFLRLYHFLFRRITHGATRLQEILADRVAVRNYGASSFEEGLRHIIRREVEFNHLASAEIRRAAEARRELANLYQLPEVTDDFERKSLGDRVNDIITRPTTEDDTHPSPIDRFIFASRIACNNTQPADGMVWDFFTDREALTGEMSRLIEQNVKESAMI